jgi:hypothetical protein
VLDSDGNIYIGRVDGLAKYSSAGTLLWLNGTSSTSVAPLIASDGTIYSRSNSGLAAVTNDGQLKWKYFLSGTLGVNAALAILSDGAIITQSSEKIIAINQDATERWLFDPGRALRNANSIGAFVIDSSGNIFVTIDDYVYKISSAGNLIWEKKLGNEYSSLALGADNTLYLSVTSWAAGGSWGAFYALDATDGSTKWADTGSFNNRAQLAPVIDSAGKVYVIMSYGGAWLTATKLQSYNATSTMSWSNANLSSLSAAPILTSDGKIYVADQKALKIFDAASGARLANLDFGDNGDLYTYFGAINSSGTIYTANSDTLYAIDD